MRWGVDAPKQTKECMLAGMPPIFSCMIDRICRPHDMLAEYRNIEAESADWLGGRADLGAIYHTTTRGTKLQNAKSHVPLTHNTL